MTDLSGKRAIVSGASRGIGRGVAIELARAGAEVVVNFRSHPEEAQQVVDQCRDLSGRDVTQWGDFADPQAIQDLVDDAVKRMGGIDIVVSNAVYSDRHLFLDSDLAEFKKTVCSMGCFPFRTCGRAEDGGCGNGCDGGDQQPHAHKDSGAMAYNMAKAANDQMRTAACELAGDRIRQHHSPGLDRYPGHQVFLRGDTGSGRRRCLGDDSASRKSRTRCRIPV